MDYWGAGSPGCFDVSQKISAQDVMHEQACCHDEAANHQLPIATAIFIVLSLLTNENIEVVLLINCLAWRGVLVMDNTLPIKKHS